MTGFSRATLALFVGLAASGAIARPTITDRTYFVGNSLTAEFIYNNRFDFPQRFSPWFAQMVNLRYPGQYNNWDIQTGPGGQLNGYYSVNGPDFDYGVARTRKVREAFADPDPLTRPQIIVLQPFDQVLDYPSWVSPGDAANADVATIQRYLDLLDSAGNTDAQVFIYATWPRRARSNGSAVLHPQPFDYRTQWDKRYDQFDPVPGFNVFGRFPDNFNTVETRDYFRLLTQRVNANNPNRKKPLRITPVGDVFYELENRMTDGYNEFGPDFFPELNLNNFNDFYVDQIHRTHIGAYLVSMTIYSSIFGISPKPTAEFPEGLSSLPFGLGLQLVPEQRLKLEALLQDVVWDLLKVSDGTAGIPEPATTFGLGAVGAMLLKRRSGRR